MTRTTLEEPEAALTKSEFWMKAAAWSFGAWAILLAIVGWLVSRGIDEVLKAESEARAEFRAFAIQMEHRMTEVEAENDRDKGRLEKLERYVDRFKDGK